MKLENPMSDQQRRLAEENLALVWQTIAKRIRLNEEIPGLGFDDLFQEGAWALCLAAVSYRPETNVPFSAYARPVIRNHLLDYCRRITLQSKRMVTVPLDAPSQNGQPPPVQLPAYEIAGGEDWDTHILLEQLLDHGKHTYTGVERLGIEAIEMKLRGYTGTDIARLYHTGPTNVGAWISKAAKKLKSDQKVRRLMDYDIEPKVSSF